MVVRIIAIRRLRDTTFKLLAVKYHYEGIKAVLTELAKRYKTTVPGFVINLEGCQAKDKEENATVLGYYEPGCALINFRYAQPKLSTIVHEFIHHVQRERALNRGGWEFMTRCFGEMCNSSTVPHDERPVEHAAIRITAKCIVATKLMGYE